MKIIMNNTTHYRTNDLKRIVRACLKHVGREQINITIEYTRAHGLHQSYGDNIYQYIRGCAYLNSPYVRMKIQKYYWKKSEVDRVCDIGCGNGHLIEELPKEIVKKFAQVLIHEIHHNLGLNHDEMINYTQIDASFIKGYQIRAKEKKKKPKVSKTEQRYESALRNLKNHEKKLRREKKLVTKWRNKVKYYEKVYSYAACNKEGK